MRLRTISMLLIAVIAAAAAAGFAQSWLSSQRALLDAELAARQMPVPKVEAVEILVARRGLPVGTFAKIEHFDWRPFPEDGVTDAYIVRNDFNEGDLDGAVLRSSMTAGDPLTRGRLVRPGERGFLAAVLKPDMRAVSVPINATTGISGFVFPGDTVDLLLTHVIKTGRVQGRATETLLHDLRVLAVDQRTDDQEGTPVLAKTVTLEVRPEQAETIAVAMEMGRLSLALRALARVPDAPATASPVLANGSALQRPIALTAIGTLSGGTGSAAKQPARPGTTGTIRGNSSIDSRTYTLDSDASQLIQRGSISGAAPTVQVQIVRAGVVQTLSFGKSNHKSVNPADAGGLVDGGAEQ